MNIKISNKTLIISLAIAIMIFLSGILYLFNSRSSLPFIPQQESYVSTNKKSGNISPMVKKIADQFIINKVGEQEFKKNYVIDPKNSDDCPDNTTYGCYLSYRFIPCQVYECGEYLFYYTANNKSVVIANNKIPLDLPSCEKDINKCNFKISLDELKKIANRENLMNSFRAVMKDNKILIEISYCNMETSENRRKILVDPVSSDIVWRGPNSECQGIF
jgi:hypothetical protein